VKTGFTKAAGRVLVSSAYRQGRRLVCVTINDGDDWRDHTVLLENGFSDYCVQNIITEGQCLGMVSILGGQADQVQLLAEESFSFPLRADETVKLILSGPGFAYAPVVQGKQAGFAYVLLGEKTVGKVSLIYGQTVEQETVDPPSFWERLFGGRT